MELKTFYRFAGEEICLKPVLFWLNEYPDSESRATMTGISNPPDKDDIETVAQQKPWETPLMRCLSMKESRNLGNTSDDGPGAQSS